MLKQFREWWLYAVGTFRSVSPVIPRARWFAGFNPDASRWPYWSGQRLALTACCFIPNSGAVQKETVLPLSRAAPFFAWYCASVNRGALRKKTPLPLHIREIILTDTFTVHIRRTAMQTAAKGIGIAQLNRYHLHAQFVHLLHLIDL